MGYSLLVFLSVFLLGAGAPPAGFEFRGLRTGLAQTDVAAIVGAQLECIRVPGKEGRLCSAPPEMKAPSVDVRFRHMYVVLNAADVVWSVNYQFQTSASESPESFAKAFSAKYGKPTVTTQHYRNALGEPVSGLEYSWHRDTQELAIQELCFGQLDQHCIVITDAALGPKPAAPQI